MKKYARYKDSGISWIGDVPEHWNYYPFYALFEQKSQCGFCDEELLSVYLDKGVIRFSDAGEKRANATSEDLSKYQLVEEGDFVLNNQQAWRGSVGVSFFRGIVSPAYVILKMSEKLERTFANYLLRNRSMVAMYCLASKGVGSIQRNLVWNKVKRSAIFIPPLPEQKAIAEYLDKKTAQINELVSAKQKQIELLKEYKQSVIANAVTGKMNKNRRMKDSGISWIGKIPENWECSTLRKHLKFVSDKGHPNEQLLSVTREQGVIIRNVESKEENHNVIPEDLSDYKLVKQGQFAINKMKSWQGSYGVSSYTGIVSPAYYVCDLDFENKDFFSIAIRSKAYIPFFTMYSKGIRVDQWDLSPIGLKTIPFFIPPADEQDKIVSFVKDKMERIDSQIASIENQIANLNEYKQSLISDVVTGKVKV
ncbi:restriction endonuclease subunit S [Fibrobacter sp.]